MHPHVTTLHFHGVSWTIGSYGALLALALWVGAWLGLARGKRDGLEEGALISSLALAVAGGFIGAFVCSIGVRWLQLGSLQAAIAQPGIVFYGALLGGALSLAAAAHAFGLPLLATWDAMLPALPIAHAIGRIGCFFGGCCYGAPSQLPWAVHYPGEAIARHPWPLYEAALLCALALLFWRATDHTPGRRALLYVLSYACVRLTLEPLRGDALRGVFGTLGLSTSQLISLFIIAACVYALKKLRPAAQGSAAGRAATRNSLTA
jgi:phosphatidylglycerol:prolipoprotein diacylglycerol transferase